MEEKREGRKKKKNIIDKLNILKCLNGMVSNNAEKLTHG